MSLVSIRIDEFPVDMDDGRQHLANCMVILDVESGEITGVAVFGGQWDHGDGWAPATLTEVEWLGNHLRAGNEREYLTELAQEKYIEQGKAELE